MHGLLFSALVTCFLAASCVPSYAQDAAILHCQKDFAEEVRRGLRKPNEIRKFFPSCLERYGVNPDTPLDDPLLGIWVNDSPSLLNISKIGSTYIVKWFGNFGARLISTFAGPYKDGRILTNSGPIPIADKKAFFRGGVFSHIR